MTASTGPPAWAAKSIAPASPPLPPLVDTSVIVRLVSRPARTCASSSSAAVPDSCARDPGAAASRCASSTICPLRFSGRVAITVCSVRGPSIVCARTLLVCTVNGAALAVWPLAALAAWENCSAT